MMTQFLRGRCLLRVLACGLLAGAAFADGAAPAAGETADDKIARLEALLEAQQQQLQTLEKQAAAAQAKDVDAARVEETRRMIREILNETEFRESLMSSTTQVGYDNGFYIKSSDDKFKMVFNGLFQFRFTEYGTRSTNRYLLPSFQRNDRAGFDVQRMRFAVSGHVYDKNLTYHIEFKADAPQNGDFVFDSGWVNYRFADEFQIKLGQFTLPTMRSAWQQSQLVDHGVTDAVYNLGASVGVQFWGQTFNKRLDYYLCVVTGTADSGNTNNAATITPDPAASDNNPAVLFRTVWHVLSENPDTDFATQSDIDIHQHPVLDLGFHYAFNDQALEVTSTRLPVPRLQPFGTAGSFGLVPMNGVQMNQFGVDTQFKWQGFAVVGEYIGRVIDPTSASYTSFPYSPWYLASGDGSTTLQNGAYLQGGYMLPIPGFEKKIELVARVGGISALAEHQTGTWEYAAGVNYFIDRDKVRLQTDFVKVDEVPITSSYNSLANVNDDALIWRVQLSVSF